MDILFLTPSYVVFFHADLCIFQDIFPVHRRGLAISFYSLGPICGPAIGPVAGGFLAEAKGWRWIFWLLTILVNPPHAPKPLENLLKRSILTSNRSNRAEQPP